MSRSTRSTLPVLTLGLAAALALAACSGGDADSATSGSTPAASSSTSDAAGTTTSATLEVVDAWAKAADEGMSAAFGVLSNPGGQDVVVVGASSPASPVVELHETVEVDGVMQMREVESFTVPAGGTFALEPGGNHLMFMGLTEPLVPGAETTVTFELADGGTVEITAPVKDYAGANEEYAGGEHDMSEMDDTGDTSDGHDMGGTEHDGSADH